MGRIPNSLMGVPLTGAGKMLGVMVAAKYEAGQNFSNPEFEIFKLIGGQISVALQNAIIYKQVEFNAMYDLLTGLYNRRHLYHVTELELANFKPDIHPISFVMIDLDYFKNINDKYGHLAGDQIITATAKVCLKHLRRIDIIGRYGGEEFLIVMPGTPVESAVLVAQRLCSAIAEQKTCISGNELSITASLGVSQYLEGDGISSVIDRADKALYISKQSGRNQVNVLNS